MKPISRPALAFVALALAASPATAEVVCESAYEWFNGKDTVSAIPGEATENGALAAELYDAHSGAWLGQFMGKPKSEGLLHEVRVSQCGREVCRAEKGTLDLPRPLLTFRISEVESPHSCNVFAQIIDIETGKIIAQREYNVTGTDDVALAQGMQDAAARLDGDGVTFGPLSDGKAG